MNFKITGDKSKLSKEIIINEKGEISYKLNSQILPIKEKCTYIVNSNETLTDWLNSVEGNDYSYVCIIEGEYHYDGEAKALDEIGTIGICGIWENKKPIIVFENKDAKFWYTKTPYSSKYYIKELNIEQVEGHISLENCINISECEIDGSRFLMSSSDRGTYWTEDCINWNPIFEDGEMGDNRKIYDDCKYNGLYLISCDTGVYYFEGTVVKDDNDEVLSTDGIWYQSNLIGADYELTKIGDYMYASSPTLKDGLYYSKDGKIWSYCEEIVNSKKIIEEEADKISNNLFSNGCLFNFDSSTEEEYSNLFINLDDKLFITSGYYNIKKNIIFSSKNAYIFFDNITLIDILSKNILTLIDRYDDNEKERIYSKIYHNDYYYIFKLNEPYEYFYNEKKLSDINKYYDTKFSYIDNKLYYNNNEVSEENGYFIENGILYSNQIVIKKNDLTNFLKNATLKKEIATIDYNKLRSKKIEEIVKASFYGEIVLFNKNYEEYIPEQHSSEETSYTIDKIKNNIIISNLKQEKDYYTFIKNNKIYKTNSCYEWNNNFIYNTLFDEYEANYFDIKDDNYVFINNVNDEKLDDKNPKSVFVGTNINDLKTFTINPEQKNTDNIDGIYNINKILLNEKTYYIANTTSAAKSLETYIDTGIMTSSDNELVYSEDLITWTIFKEGTRFCFDEYESNVSDFKDFSCFVCGEYLYFAHINVDTKTLYFSKTKDFIYIYNIASCVYNDDEDITRVLIANEMCKILESENLNCYLFSYKNGILKIKEDSDSEYLLSKTTHGFYKTIIEQDGDIILINSEKDREYTYKYKTDTTNEDLKDYGYKIPLKYTILEDGETRELVEYNYEDTEKYEKYKNATILYENTKTDEEGKYIINFERADEISVKYKEGKLIFNGKEYINDENTRLQLITINTLNNTIISNVNVIGYNNYNTELFYDCRIKDDDKYMYLFTNSTKGSYNSAYDYCNFFAFEKTKNGKKITFNKLYLLADSKLEDANYPQDFNINSIVTTNTVTNEDNETTNETTNYLLIIDYTTNNKFYNFITNCGEQKCITEINRILKISGSTKYYEIYRYAVFNNLIYFVDNSNSKSVYTYDLTNYIEKKSDSVIYSLIKKDYGVYAFYNKEETTNKTNIKVLNLYNGETSNIDIEDKTKSLSGLSLKENIIFINTNYSTTTYNINIMWIIENSDGTISSKEIKQLTNQSNLSYISYIYSDEKNLLQPSKSYTIVYDNSTSTIYNIKKYILNKLNWNDSKVYFYFENNICIISNDKSNLYYLDFIDNKYNEFININTTDYQSKNNYFDLIIGEDNFVLSSGKINYGFYYPMLINKKITDTFPYLTYNNLIDYLSYKFLSIKNFYYNAKYDLDTPLSLKKYIIKEKRFFLNSLELDYKNFLYINAYNGFENFLLLFLFYTFYNNDDEFISNKSLFFHNIMIGYNYLINYFSKEKELNTDMSKFFLIYSSGDEVKKSVQAFNGNKKYKTNSAGFKNSIYFISGNNGLYFSDNIDNYNSIAGNFKKIDTNYSTTNGCRKIKNSSMSPTNDIDYDNCENIGINQVANENIFGISKAFPIQLL